jgi:hypothetical protein
MSLLAGYEQDADRIAADAVARPAPPKPQEVKFSAWRMGSAAPRGIAAGAAESSGFMADVLGAFGQTMAATDARAGGMFSAQSAAERKQQDDSRQKLITQGPDYSSEAGDLFRNVARDYRPDPQTAHVAESLVFDASRVITKAVGYSVTAGPLAGAAITGTDEATQVADDLRLKGVDLETRTKAGAVQGAGVALGVALPVAGKTLAQTVGLVAVGGPGAFVAQQAATREILQQAGYEEIGAQYDPFDPVGLAVSTLVPLPFAALAMRRARPGAPAAEAAPVRVEPETVDAARVALASEQAEASRLTSPADLPGRAAEDAAIARAEEQLAAGERAEVGEVIPAADRLRAAMDTLPLREPEPIIPRGFDPETAIQAADTLRTAGLGDVRMVETVADLPESLRAKIEGEGTDARGGYDPATDTTYLVRSNIADLDEAFYVGLHESFHRGLRKSLGAEVEPVLQVIHDGNERVRAMTDAYMREKGIADRLEAVEEVLADMAARAETGDLKGWDQLLAVIKQAVAKWAKAAGVQIEVTDKMVADLVAGMRKAGLESKPKAQVEVRAEAEPKGGAAEGANPFAARAAEIEATQPDLLVQIDGLDGPVTVRELLAGIRAEADQDIANAPLLQAAAECAITGT